MSLNSFTISGNIATDIELRRTHGKGIAVATFRVAVSHGKDRDASFFDVVVWDTGAERVEREFKKGDTIALVGYLTTEQWVDKTTGKNRSRVVLRATHHERVDRRNRNREDDRATECEEDADPIGRVESRHD